MHNNFDLSFMPKIKLKQISELLKQVNRLVPKLERKNVVVNEKVE